MVELEEIRSRYSCADYLDGPYADTGFFDRRGQFELITPVEESEEKLGSSFLAIGRAGVDGIEFGYREGQQGVWAYYPIDDQFSLLAPNVMHLVEGWSSGEIKV